MKTRLRSQRLSSAKCTRVILLAVHELLQVKKDKKKKKQDKKTSSESFHDLHFVQPHLRNNFLFSRININYSFV